MLFGLLCITFAISHVAPGDPARLAAGPDATASMVEKIRAEYGLDRPFPIQFAQYLQGVLSGDLGRSLRTRETVAADLARYFPNTFELVTGAMLLAVGLGVPLGILSAVYRDTWVDQLTRVVSVSGIAIPAFWAGLMLQLLLALHLGLLPLGGRLGLMTAPPTPFTHLLCVDALLGGHWRVLGDALVHAVLPTVTLCFPALASIVRVNRAEMLGGTVLVETVFDWPGIGLYAVASAVSSDFQPIMGVTLVIGLNFMLANFLVDLAYGWLDPRVRPSISA